jgi:hypothetical protein
MNRQGGEVAQKAASPFFKNRFTIMRLCSIKIQSPGNRKISVQREGVPGKNP